MKRELFILVLILTIASFAGSIFSFLSIDWKSINWTDVDEEILGAYGVGAVLLVASIGFGVLTQRTYQWWQFDVKLDRMLAEFDEKDEGDDIDISCPSKELANEFHNRRKYRIKYSGSYQETYKKILGTKIPSRK